MKQAVIIDCVRTPIGRSHKNMGFFRDVRADELAVPVIKALLQRTGIDPALVEDVVFGVTGQRDEHGFNLARMLGLMAGLPVSTAGTTINRLCGSSLQALSQASHAIAFGSEDVQIIGGVEHMLHVIMETDEIMNPKLFEFAPRESLNMGYTAERVAQKFKISRQAQDEFSVNSHKKAAAAHAAGEFNRELIPVMGHDRKGTPFLVKVDQCVRPETSVDQLAALQPAFEPGTGTVTAGNSSPINDGAAAMLVMSDERAKSLGLKPLVRVVATAVAGVEPELMGTGPIPATQKVLKRARLTLKDIDLIELNEAFAAQSLTCIQQLGIDESKLNVRGGAIAIGHPTGAGGARISTTLINNMIDRGATLGLATMCVGVGQGVAVVYERV